MTPEPTTERAKLEQGWRDGFFAHSVDLLCIVGLDGYLKMLNPAWENTLGFSREELMSRPFITFVHPEDHSATKREMRSLGTGAITQLFENRYLCKNGSYKWLSWAALPVLEESCIYASGREMTDMKEGFHSEAFTWISQQEAIAMLGRRALHAQDVEDLLNYSAQVVSRALNVDYCRVCEFLPDGKSAVIRAGAGWRQETVGLTFDADERSQAGFTLGSKMPVVTENVKSETRFSIPHLLLDHNVTTSMTVVIPGPERGFGFIGADSSHERTFSQVDLRFSQAVADVLGIVMGRVRVEEENRKLTEQLERHIADLSASNREMEAFTYSVSHDLRAPLRHVDGFARILLEDMSEQLSEEGRRYLRLIRDGAVRMSQLIEDLLKLGRVGRQALHIQTTGLNALVDEVIRGLKPEIKGRSIEWRVEALPFVECDAELMKLVFTNFLSNAVKYTRTREKAVIEVGAQLGPDGPVIFVRDNGVGFNMKYANKLFGVFQRLHRQEDFEGVGVGLATVQRILGKHGGRAWAESELNRGATFYFSLGSEESGDHLNTQNMDVAMEVH